jgi:hypothetical protein
MSRTIRLRFLTSEPFPRKEGDSGILAPTEINNNGLLGLFLSHFGVRTFAVRV